MALPAIAAGAMRIGAMFSRGVGKSGGLLRRAILKKTKVKRESIARDKVLNKRSLERRRRRDKESLLESFRTRGKSGMTPDTPGKSFLQRVLEFIGVLLIGWLVDKLPQIIKWIEDFKKRVELLVDSLKNFIKNLGDWMKSIGNVVISTLENWSKFDFSDNSGKVDAAMKDLENAFKGMEDAVDDAKTAVTGTMEDVEVAGGGEFDGELSGDAVERTKQLLRSSEGFREKAYWDVNAWRIGYGTDTITDAQGNVTSVTKDSVVTREDAERDLERRVRTGFMPKVAGQVGDNWTKLPANAQAALTSVGYNYGSLPQSVVAATRGGNLNDIADAVEALKTHDKGVNARRRMEEAAIIRKSASPGAGDGKARRQKNQTPAYQQAVKVGRSLESQGYRAWQHPDFSVYKGYTGSGMERVMRRSYNSYHNYGEALDFPLSHNTEAQLNKLAKYFSDNRSALGVAELKWKDDANHFDHLHVSFKGGGSGLQMATGPDPATGLAPAPATSNFDMAKFRKYLAEAMAQQQQQVAQPKQQSQESSGPSAPQMMNPTSNLNSMLFTALSFV